MLKPLIIGIAGGSGSGKSTVAKNVAELLTTSSVAFIDMDAYYKNFPDISLDERKKLNRDHPVAIEMIVAKIQRRLQRATDGAEARRTPSAERPAPPART